jgi:hypothetical protein
VAARRAGSVLFLQRDLIVTLQASRGFDAGLDRSISHERLPSPPQFTPGDILADAVGESVQYMETRFNCKKYYITTIMSMGFNPNLAPNAPFATIFDSDCNCK